MTEMTETRLLEIISAYGARSAFWPEPERGAALELLETSPKARQAVRDAASLEAMLDQSDLPPISLALQSRIAAIPERRRESLLGTLNSLWPFGPVWRPAGGLVAAAVLGLMVGISMPQDDGVRNLSVSENFVAVIAAAGGDVEENLQ